MKEVSDQLDRPPDNEELSIDQNVELGVSMDSGINGSLSPTGSHCSQPEHIAQAFNSQLCIMTPRASPIGCSSENSSLEVGKEMDNLVEEVYIAKHSIAKGIGYVDEVDTYEAMPIVTEPPDVELTAVNINNNNNNFVEKVVVNIQNERNESTTTCPYDVIVSIDIGTTYSGYAFAFTKNSGDKQIHMMRQIEGGDRGLNNQKVPTVLLLTPDEKFHSFGFTARDFYHDLEPEDATEWLYFDKFKISLHNNMDVNRDSQLTAVNGRSVSALVVFSFAFGYFKKHIERELEGQGLKTPKREIRWVITVPALWTQQAKQFVREAAYMVGICSVDRPEQLLIALEPEAASICCRHLHFDQLVKFESGPMKSGSYMVVDCGGGTVDITVHSVSSLTGTLRELHKATGGPCGSVGIDEEFVKLLKGVFGTNFIERFRQERPAAYNDLMLSFESRKRCATTHRTTSLNIFPPFAFIDFYRQATGDDVSEAIKKYGRPELTWSNEGILKIHPSLMYNLFQSTLDKIVDHIEAVLSSRRIDDSISHLFLVGGFSESQILQETIKNTFGSRVHILIPQAVSLSVLKGGVLYGMNPSIVASRRVTHTYGVGVVKPFINGVHPVEKLVIRGGHRWCVDVLERFIESGDPVTMGQVVSRKYAPASNSQSEIILQLYATVSKSAQFITDPNVFKCGKLTLKLPPQDVCSDGIREIVVSLVFGGSEVTAFAIDSSSGESVRATLEFMV